MEYALEASRLIKDSNMRGGGVPQIALLFLAQQCVAKAHLQAHLPVGAHLASLRRNLAVGILGAFKRFVKEERGYLDLKGVNRQEHSDRETAAGFEPGSEILETSVDPYGR